MTAQTAAQVAAEGSELLAEDDREIHDGDCEAEWETGAMAYTVCGCVPRLAAALAGVIDAAVGEAVFIAWNRAHASLCESDGATCAREHANPYRAARRADAGAGGGL